MNNQYDELMKQIIQAEYDFNNALANAFKPFVYMVDNREKCTEQKRDESYLQGAEDMLEASRILTDLRKNGGMPCNDMACIFGSTNSSYIILHKSAEEILNGVDQWKKEKQEEFKPGDEVEVIKDCHLDLGGKYVIMPEDCQPNTKPKIYSIVNLSNFNKTWAYADHLKKTGIVHKSLTIYFRGEDE